MQHQTVLLDSGMFYFLQIFNRVHNLLNILLLQQLYDLLL